MQPNLYVLEKLVAQRRRELEREVAYSYLLAGQPRQRLVMVRHLMAQLGSLLVALGSRMQQLEQNQQHNHVAYHQ
jgi:hypothetical protein